MEPQPTDPLENTELLLAGWARELVTATFGPAQFLDPGYRRMHAEALLQRAEMEKVRATIEMCEHAVAQAIHHLRDELPGSHGQPE